jgi:hypothetical protein
MTHEAKILFTIKRKSIGNLKYLNEIISVDIPSTVYDTELAIAAPSIPIDGMSIKFSTIFKTAAAVSNMVIQ